MANLQKVGDRENLKARRDPYWARLEQGCSLGLRKMKPGSEGSWLARSVDETTGKRIFKALGEFESLPQSQRFDAARKAAVDWFVHLGKGGSTEEVTVRLACERYVAHLRETKGDPAADDAQSRFTRRVISDGRLASTDLTKLKPAQIKAWRAALATLPVVVGYGVNARERPRSASALNRDMTSFRAALNHALEEGFVTSDFAWKSGLKPIKNADKARAGYLDVEQRKALIGASVGAVANFLTGLALLPVRPGALAALKVGSFDKRLNALAIGKDKSGRDRKIILPEATAALFANQVESKLPTAFLFTRDGGEKWGKDAWKGPVKEAARAAGLPDSTTAYTLRHSVITDLIHDGLDTLTVAQLSGTSLAMIEKHYGHLTQSHATKALARLAV